ncbi:MAG: cell wall hydrolase [Lachnospiraceae bacterium]|nr:cell wall hydrolase [Lachnospiraceae bacterium]
MDNNKNETKYISVIIFSIVIIAFTVCYKVVGNATQNNMSDLESEKKSNEENLSSYEQQASGLLETKTSLENLVSGLNSEIALINEKIADIEKQIADKTLQIEATGEELESAKISEQKQYDDMKLRIKFIYEMGETSYFDVLLSGASFVNTLNKVEYVSELIKYDRTMMNKYQDTMRLIEEKEKSYQSEQQELLTLKEELSAQRQLIADKITSTNEQILLYADDIAAAEAAALEYERKIEANRRAIEDESRRIEESSILEAESIERANRERESREKASREESIRNEQGSSGKQEETTSPQNSGENKPNYKPAADDIDMLAALIECEAGDQSYYGMLCVGAVVMNRISSSRFPNTLYEVIYQPYQFTPVTVSGRFALVLARGANETCYRAAREVLEQGNIVGSWLFFRMNDGSRQGEIIGDHVFY